MITVKRGDRYAITYTVSMDVTGCTTRLLARPVGEELPLELPHEVTDAAAGELTHMLDGALQPGDYLVEVEVTTPAGDPVTFPTRQKSGVPQFERLRVIHDIG